MMEFIVSVDDHLIDVRDILHKLRTNNKPSKKQYHYVLVVVVSKDGKMDLKFFYFNYYKPIRKTLEIVFKNSVTYIKPDPVDPIRKWRIIVLGDLHIIMDREVNPSAQWIMSLRKDGEIYTNDITSFNFYLQLRGKKNIFQKFWDLVKREKKD